MSLTTMLPTASMATAASAARNHILIRFLRFRRLCRSLSLTWSHAKRCHHPILSHAQITWPHVDNPAGRVNARAGRAAAAVTSFINERQLTTRADRFAPAECVVLIVRHDSLSPCDRLGARRRRYLRYARTGAPSAACRSRPER